MVGLVVKVLVATLVGLIRGYLTVRQTVYRRRPGLHSRRTHDLEQSAGHCNLCSVSVDLPSHSSETIGNESVPIQLEQCLLPGLAISNAKILLYF